ncbi:MAG: tRNA lysidine(34) synthetase TilS, partial [Marinirhabdus sp.]|nr:tRNA lysidine(34) synthetase TilS [Marinirhabdus sp.]
VKNFEQQFRKTQNHLQESQALIDDYMALVYNLVVAEVQDGYSINVEKITELPHTEALLYELLSPFSFTNWSDVYALLNAQTGKTVFSPTHQLLRNRNELLLTERTENVSNSEYFINKNEKVINNPIHLRFIPTKKIGNIENTTIYVDAEQLTYPLTLRKWEEGDLFQPFGMKGKKKVSKFFKDEKLSLVAKEKVWLLCNQDKIVWIVNYRADDRYKVTAATKNILKITTQE